MSKAAIFDLNGVFIRSPFLSDRFGKDFGVPVQEFLPALGTVMDIVRLPGAPDVFDMFSPHLERWGVRLTREEFFDYWFSAEEQDAGMVGIARMLREDGWRLFILSNNFRERAAYYAERFPFLDELFEEVYYSWRTGHVKPDPRCFLQITEGHALDPHHCWYFDDSPSNVEAANSLGMHARPFESAEQVCGLLFTR